jgi:hypothetical protein
LDGHDAILEQTGRCERRLAIIELGEGDLGVSVDERPLIDAPDALEIADIERILNAAIARMLTFEFAKRMFIIGVKRS